MTRAHPPRAEDARRDGDGIAVVGMACRYADAPTPEALWETVLAGRRAFRRIPDERLRRTDYVSADRAALDRTYSTQAAVLTDWTFPRERFRVARSTVQATDLAHWLALEVASDALADAGYPEAAGAPRDVTAVVIGNTLTGDRTRANTLRLRWPYVRRVVDAALAEEGWAPERRAGWLAVLEGRYKAPFPAADADTLAGGLPNTIAGRICNQWDLHGGGYAVDGACASSLLAVITACTTLAAGDADLVLAGGVDLSLDPFELVGFAKAGALADDAMRVYDARSRGFWPGEGCGIVALMREADARAERRRVHAVVRGWGVSSDGAGGITRPTVAGQRLAIERAYRRARFGTDAVRLFEGHGTGTAVGDATELRALSEVRAAALGRGGGPRAAVGSIKANIGHTKAAAGVAGLLKAVLAVRERLVPPTTGCETPHAELSRDDAVLEVCRDLAPWPDDVVARAGVSAMGFGGINTHVVVEEAGAPRARVVTTHERRLAASPQDAELFALAADDAGELARRADAVAARVEDASSAELGDIAASLTTALAAADHRADGAVPAARACVVAGTPGAAAARLRAAAALLRAGTASSVGDGVYVGIGSARPRIGFLCSGQGAPVPDGFGFVGCRFPEVAETPGTWGALGSGSGPADTAVAQPNIVRASLAGLRVLDRCRVRADVAVGHSLGELVALHWAGVFDDAAAWRVAAARGRAMSACDGLEGAMAGLAIGADEVRQLINAAAAADVHAVRAGHPPLVIAAYNGERQVVVAGTAAAVDAVVTRARASGVRATRLAVSHAFHSPLVAPAAAALDEALCAERLRSVARRVVSTVTGAPLPPDADVGALLRAQVTAPVRFTEAFAAAAPDVALWVEVGPGDVLCGLARTLGVAPALPVWAESEGARPLCAVLGAAFALGAPVDVAALYAHRFTRPADLERRPTFIASPCESAPPDDAPAATVRLDRLPQDAPNATAADPADQPAASDALTVVRRLVAERTELSLDRVRPDDHLLADLHLSSITVGEILGAAARALNLSPSAVPTEYADATVAETATALAAARSAPAPTEHAVAGAGPWVRAFAPVLLERPRPAHVPPSDVSRPGGAGGWTVLALPAEEALGADACTVAALAGALRERLTRAPGGGTVVCVGASLDSSRRDAAVELLLAAAADAARRPRGLPLAVVHTGDHEAAAFARVLHLERPGATTCVLGVPPGHPGATAWVCDELAAARGFVETHLGSDGRRRAPALRHHPLPQNPHGRIRDLLSADDLLLVTGGGKGIAAECALDLARATGARLALLGRARPEADEALAATLDRMRAAGVTARYEVADVTDPEAVRRAVSAATDTLGPVTAVLHGAGVNEPCLAAQLDPAAVARAVAPKVDGARHVLAAVDPGRLRAWVSFGSVIARAGLAGEAHYALANAALARLTETLQRELPHCRCRCVEWSVWAGVGMGERLARIEALSRQGITPIHVDDGVAALRRVLADATCPVCVVVAGRLGDAPTLEFDGPPLPLRRFLERPRVWYPGVELVADAVLSPATDPYLDDHVVGGVRVLPAVIALEAIAQAAEPLGLGRRLTLVEQLELLRPILVPDDGPVTVRVAALARDDDGSVDVVVRSSATDYAVDHVRAVYRFGADPDGAARAAAAGERFAAAPSPIIDAAPLYGPLLFQRGRFRRLAGYDALHANTCTARLVERPTARSAATPPWFGEYLPQALLLGDPGARDGCLHAVQACVPHRMLLPVGADRLTMGAVPCAAPASVRATEVARDGDLYTYDLEVCEAGGTVCERWERVRFRVVAGSGAPGRWPPALLGPYLERRVAELVPGARVTAAVGGAGPSTRAANDDSRADSRAVTLRRLLGLAGPVGRRADGMAITPNGSTPGTGAALTLAHAGDLTIAVQGPAPLGCDAERVADRAAGTWRDLLGSHGVALAAALAHDTGEPSAASATRVWAAAEALRKAGRPREPLVFERADAEGWALLHAGDLAVVTVVVAVENYDAPLVLAVALPGAPAGRADSGVPAYLSRPSADGDGAICRVAPSR